MSNSATINPLHWHRRRHPRRRTEHIFQCSLPIIPCLYSFWLALYHLIPLPRRQLSKPNFTFLVSSSVRTTVVSFNFNLRLIYCTWLTDQLPLFCIYRRPFVYIKPLKASYRQTAAGACCLSLTSSVKLFHQFTSAPFSRATAPQSPLI